MNRRQIIAWILRVWRQNVIGTSPPPTYPTWTELAEYLLWSGLDASQKEAKVRRLHREFDDETKLLDMTFSKLGALLTPLGLIFAFGRGALESGQTISSILFIVSSCVSLIFVIWALSTRFKVFQRPVDYSLSALQVGDGEGGCLNEELAAEVWWLYQWRWHRYQTRLAIDRMFLCACLLTAVTLCIIVSDVVPWLQIWLTLTPW